MIKFTKEHQAILGLSDSELAALRNEGAAGIVMYESSQMVLDQWTLCYFGWRSEVVLRNKMNDMSLAVAEGRARKPMALKFADE